MKICSQGRTIFVEPNPTEGGDLRLKVLCIGLIAGALLFAAPLSSLRAADDDQRWAGNIEMNGFRLDSFGDFTKEWELVTVRYRVDSGEFRFVYANPVAMKALRAGSSDYPDGAVFAKVAYWLSNDPYFTSSMVPKQVNRYQLMVRDKKKFTETGGWGYALFNSVGRTYPGHPQMASKACAACHQIVRQKGDIFVEPIDFKLSFFSDKKSRQTRAVNNSKYLPKFESMPVAKLPAELAKQLPSTTKTVSSVVGDLRKNLFQGTLDEIRPFLAVEALRSKKPAILLSADAKRFSAVYKAPQNTGSCHFATAKGESMVAIVTTTKASPFTTSLAYVNADGDEGFMTVQEFCFASEEKPIAPAASES